ncbi:hypothetical protein SARC_03699 [Sphaeroforma arctica JP610]|uniref:Glycoside hydrolase family 19 catalytic domain-containing protein n=1 Tax=Sphaeroforma arctica JP610 TaxID=667725 RepID=A0A0L0G5J6_9EUKA|nr:hypothetical protein SARC_03699 [Sphaeroforma arctica JP610]KNC84071.1 hypothetical protein SARC_03699 [Sphaeroforma arctica JP610]|eukprot:XP_014157973.1 hypothetical protein SARC_03699 [Sphaeroforma arctica JP610]
MFASVIFLLCMAYVNAGASLLTKDMFNEMFSKRTTSPNCVQATEILTFEAFHKTAKYYPKFCNEGSKTDQKKRLDGGLGSRMNGASALWRKLHVQPVREVDTPVPGVSYHGRGAIQITWNYNYGRVSEFFFGDKNILLKNPEKLIDDGVIAFRASLDFWMTPVEIKPSCHGIIINKAPECPAKGRYNGYGGTTNVINGGPECNTPTSQKVKNRVEYFKRYAKILGVSPGDHLYCDKAVAYNAGRC